MQLRSTPSCGWSRVSRDRIDYKTTMRLLGLDVGSSSVKAAILGGRTSKVAHAAFKTNYDDSGQTPRADVSLDAIERAIRGAIRQLDDAKSIDRVVLSTMSPSWVALDRRGRPLTSVVTHQDRRSLDQAREVERRVGLDRHLALSGNRPFPGGISSTTWLWHLTHAGSAMKRAALVGHLGTWLAFAMTGARTIDVSNAGFTGLLDVERLAWSDELVSAVGVDRLHLPDVVESNAIVGSLTKDGARRFGLKPGVELIAGCVDGSAGMFASGARVGQLVNVSGSTDVLALCVARPSPHAQLLTRPLGVGRRWVSVGTIAAAGTALSWVQRTFYPEVSTTAFFKRLKTLAHDGRSTRVTFHNALAGSRVEIEPRYGALDGLTLGTDRDDVLRALIVDLTRQSGERLTLLREANVGTAMRRDVFVTGGGGKLAATVLRRDWPRRFRYRVVEEATLGGLKTLATMSS